MTSAIKNAINQAKEVIRLFKTDYILVIDNKSPILYEASELSESRIGAMEKMGCTIIRFYWVRKQVIMEYTVNKSIYKKGQRCNIQIVSYLRFEDEAIKVECTRNQNSIISFYRYGAIKARTVKNFAQKYLAP